MVNKHVKKTYIPAIFIFLDCFTFIFTALKKINFIYLFLAMLGSSLLHGLFSSCSKQRLLFGCSALALGCAGFMSCSSWGLQNTGSIVWCMGLVALQHVESSQIRDRTHVSPALAGGFFTTEPPGKTYFTFLSINLKCFIDSFFKNKKQKTLLSTIWLGSKPR